MDRISVSQIKTFISSKSDWAGKYILGIKEKYSSDAMTLGHIYEDWIMLNKDSFDEYKKDLFDVKKSKELLENLKHNSEGLDFIRGENDYLVEGKLFGQDIIGYIDSYTEDEIIDIKTCQYLTKKDGGPPPWGGMNNYDAYKLQLWVYHKLTGVKKTKIIEVSKHRYKQEDRHEHQVIEFKRTKKKDEEMEKKYGPIVEEMLEMWNKFKK